MTYANLNPTVVRIKMGGPENTDQVTAHLSFHSDTLINQENFPLTPSATPWEDDVEFIDPNRLFGEEEGLQMLKTKGLLRPTYEHGIRFAQQLTEVHFHQKPLVVFFHEAWQDPTSGHGRIICVRRRTGERRLFLGNPASKCEKNCILVGVRSHKQSES